jgi:hypothetical protein
MINLPSMYTTRYGIDPGEQKLLDLTFEVRRRGNCFHPSQDTLAKWLNRSTRQIQRYLCHLRDLQLMFWRRRGKKMSNVYYLGRDLWRTLMKGRRLPGEVSQHKETSPVSRDEAKRLLAGILAGLGKGHGRPADAPA